MSKQDFYKTLGISRTASADEIKSAYRKLARKYHPDVNQDSDAQERFSAIQEAYSVLSDVKKRKPMTRSGTRVMRLRGGGAMTRGRCRADLRLILMILVMWWIHFFVAISGRVVPLQAQVGLVRDTVAQDQVVVLGVQDPRWRSNCL